MLQRRIEGRRNELAALCREIELARALISREVEAPLRLVGELEQLLESSGEACIDVESMRERARDLRRRMEGVATLSSVACAAMVKSEVDLGEMAGEIIESLRRRAPERRVDFVCAAGLVVEGDAALLRVALQCLLDNAWKFTACRERARIELGRCEHATGTEIFLRDNGIGFCDRQAGRAFLPFERLHESEETECSGVGLAVAQRILQRHGGRLRAQSRPGSGATFFIHLERAA